MIYHSNYNINHYNYKLHYINFYQLYHHLNDDLENLTKKWTKLWEGTAGIIRNANIPLSSYTEIGVCLNAYSAPNFIDFKVIPLDVIYGSNGGGQDIYFDMMLEGNRGYINLGIYDKVIDSIDLSVPTNLTMHKAYIYAR